MNKISQRYLVIKRKATFYRRLYTQLFVFGFIFLVLLTINLITTKEYLWSLWVLVAFISVFIIKLLVYYLSKKIFNKKWERKFISKRISE